MENSQASSDPITLPVDYELNVYTIKSILGQGGFGITYLAHDSSLDRDVAIKEFMPQGMAARSEDYTLHSINADDDSVCTLEWGLDRFIREAKTLSKFNHPNIVRVHTVFEANNTAYMVMSYEKGVSFQEILKKEQPSEDDLTDMIMGLLDGLEGMHAEGFIHRDIKPGNIFIRADGSALLLDFGSARQAIGEVPGLISTAWALPCIGQLRVRHPLMQLFGIAVVAKRRYRRSWIFWINIMISIHHFCYGLLNMQSARITRTGHKRWQNGAKCLLIPVSRLLPSGVMQRVVSEINQRTNRKRRKTHTGRIIWYLRH